MDAEAELGQNYGSPELQRMGWGDLIRAGNSWKRRRVFSQKEVLELFFNCSQTDHRYSEQLAEAREVWEMGKILGAEIRGDEVQVLKRIDALEVKDRIGSVKLKEK
ncbi:hypothetical protein Ancab_002536 [Ancistrocladus abbreviatus]